MKFSSLITKLNKKSEMDLNYNLALRKTSENTLFKKIELLKEIPL